MFLNVRLILIGWYLSSLNILSCLLLIILSIEWSQYFCISPLIIKSELCLSFIFNNLTKFCFWVSSWLNKFSWKSLLKFSEYGSMNSLPCLCLSLNSRSHPKDNEYILGSSPSSFSSSECQLIESFP